MCARSCECQEIKFCPFAHGPIEEQYHPDRYRSVFVPRDQCGPTCVDGSHAHQSRERRPALCTRYPVNWSRVVEGRGEGDTAVMGALVRDNFKVYPCEEYRRSGTCRNEEEGLPCFFWHLWSDRRRRLPVGVEFVYKPIMCADLMCDRDGGDSCPQSHNQYEILYHPARFRVEAHPPCTMGALCPFRHGDDKAPSSVQHNWVVFGTAEVADRMKDFESSPVFETLVEVLQGYKTSFCAGCDTPSFCSGFHGAEDLRRSPAQFYSETLCTSAQCWESMGDLERGQHGLSAGVSVLPGFCDEAFEEARLLQVHVPARQLAIFISNVSTLSYVYEFYCCWCWCCCGGG